ncbi:MAG: DUF2357 domain-containing protein [Bacilli bacterium]|nr:DUF2357 domain-containing protein [Bacilli bacterium]
MDRFFEDFNSKTQQMFEQGVSSSGLSNALEKAKIGFYEPINFDTYYSAIQSLGTLADKIVSIIAKPHFQVVDSEVILRAEQAPSLSPNSFKETMRDTGLWKKKQTGFMSPEYVHSVEKVDTIDTYENRFVAYLIDKIDEEVTKLMNDLDPSFASFENYYETRGISFSPNMLLSSFETNKPIEGVFDANSSIVGQDKVFMELSKLKRKSNKMMESEFYKRLIKKGASLNITPTNILLHDPLYNYCFRYYRDNFLGTTGSDSQTEQVYHNFVLLSFLDYLNNEKLLPSDVVVRYENGKLVFEPFSFVKGVLEFKLEQDTDGLKVMADYKGIERYNCLLVTKRTYNPRDVRTFKERRGLYFSHFEKVLLISMENFAKDFANCLTISYHKKDVNERYDGFLSSLSMIFKANRESVMERCPVCGSSKTQYRSNRTICDRCGSVYALLDEGQYIWIKTFRRFSRD